MISVISLTIWFILWWLLLFFMTVKAWMIYFKYKWTYFTLQLKWQKVLNKNIIKKIEKENWFIRNNNKYGNLKYIYKLFGTIYCIIFTISTFGVMLMAHPQSAKEMEFIATSLHFMTILPSILFYL